MSETFADFFALRTPLLAFDVLEEWARGFRSAKHTDDAESWDHDLAAARHRLRELLDDAVVREAIFLASPSLEQRAAMWRENPAAPAAAGVDVALAKYVARMASRCTPFGLFAGNSVGTLARETRFELAERAASVRHTRLDMEFLDETIARLVADDAVRPGFRFVTNSSLVEIGGTLRYAEPRSIEGRRAYFLVDVAPHDALRVALGRAREGSTLDEIAKAIAESDDEIDVETARAFADQLVDAKLLVPELGPVVTGPESVDDAIARLEAVPAASTTRSLLAAIRDALVDLDGGGVGADPHRYRDLATAAAALAPVDESHFVQVDLVKPAVATLERDLADELFRATQVLVDLFSYGRVDPLAEFRRAFDERYGERDVPLAEALDEELGIGFQASHGPGADASPLVAGLPFPPAEEEEKFAWGSRGRFLAWRLSEAVAAGARELVLDAKDLARFHDSAAPRLADAHHVLATILAPNPRDPNAPRAVLDSAGGPSGVRLLGRFCHGDPELREHVEAHLRAEEALDPDVRFFEIVHLPEGRTGNVLARPVLRDFELEYLGRSGAPREKTLSLDDLVVSVRGGRVVLRSRSLNCEVRPRMTTAHNTMWRSLGVYRFLAALQAEGCVEGASWAWGPLESQPHLPRVRLGRVVLAREQWMVPKPELDSLRADRDHAAFRAVQAWRARRGIPRWVGVVDQDNVLTIDFENPLSVAAFLDEIRGRDVVTLAEVFAPDVAVGPEGRFVNEVVIPHVRPRSSVASSENVRAGRGNESSAGRAGDSRVASPLHESRPASSARDEESFAPGSSWLTVKLYAGPALTDAALTEIAAPVAEDAVQSGAARRWFFLRYGDPDWHLRVRIHGDPKRLTTEVLPAFHELVEPWLGNRRIHRVQLDTYVRETRRYGGPDAIEACEELFFADSRAVASFLESASGDEGLDLRWRFAFVAMDRLLDDLGFEIEAKHVFAGRLATLYGLEFRLDGDLRAKLRDRYRDERRSLDDALAERGDAARELDLAYDLLRVRSESSRNASATLRRLSAANALTVPIEEIAASLLHMHANRTLRSANRAHEMILYRFLEKAYASQLARRKARVTKP